MNISELTVEQLKAMAYDQLVLLNQAQQNLNVIQQELQKREDAEKAKNEQTNSTL
jgi:phosphoribosyl-ATP pyrophosphohydrolase